MGCKKVTVRWESEEEKEINTHWKGGRNKLGRSEALILSPPPHACKVKTPREAPRYVYPWSPHFNKLLECLVY